MDRIMFDSGILWFFFTKAYKTACKLLQSSWYTFSYIKIYILQCLPSKILKSWSWVTIICGTTLLFTIVGVGGTGAVLIGKLDCPIWNCGEEATPKLFMGKLRPGFVAGPLFSQFSEWVSLVW